MAVASAAGQVPEAVDLVIPDRDADAVYIKEPVDLIYKEFFVRGRSGLGANQYP